MKHFAKPCSSSESKPQGLSGDKAGRLLHLESIRGLAALAVVLFHAVFAFFPALRLTNPAGLQDQSLAVRVIAHSPLTVFFSGPFAVVVFFVLSGFVLSHSFFLRPNFTVLISAAVRRYFRLAIPVTASTLFAYGLLRSGAYFNQEAAPLVGINHELSDFYTFVPSVATALKEGLMSVFIAVDYRASYNSVLWTMKTEFAGSFLAYVFLAVFGRWRWRWLAYIGLAVGMAVSGRFYALNFLSGIAICDLYTHRVLNRKGLFPVPLPIVAGMFVFGIYFGSYHSANLPLYCWMGWASPLLWHSIGAVLIILAAVRSRRIQFVLNAPACTQLGKISFSLYLVHFPILLSFGCYLYYLCASHALARPVAVVVATLGGVLASLLVAWLFYLWIERPVVSLGKQFIRSRLEAWQARRTKVAGS